MAIFVELLVRSIVHSLPLSLCYGQVYPFYVCAPTTLTREARASTDLQLSPLSRSTRALPASRAAQ